MNGGVFLIRLGAAYELVTGATLIAHPDDDAGGVVLATPNHTVEYVLRSSWSGGRPCTALVERRWRPVALPGRLETAATYTPTDFTLADVQELAT